MLKIFIDADACPVKQEVYKVAGRYGIQVTLVANSWMNIPGESWIKMVVVDSHLDAADDWIANNCEAHDIVITEDIPLAARCLEKDSLVLRATGLAYSQDNIGDAMATRELMSELREAGEITGGPKPFLKKDRSRFLQKLDEMVQVARRSGGR